MRKITSGSIGVVIRPPAHKETQDGVKCMTIKGFTLGWPFHERSSRTQDRDW